MSEPPIPPPGSLPPDGREAALPTDLINATEMYVRTVWELQEEGIRSLRARLAERLGLSAATISEMVARLETDGLLREVGDRSLRLTEPGRQLAESVMRKHRLAERLLVDVIGLPWQQAHGEACRWEHVISDEVEDKLIALLDRPSHGPYGNPIPGLAEDEEPGRFTTLAHAALARQGPVRVEWLSERLQGDTAAMELLAAQGLRPGVVVTVEPDGRDVLVHHQIGRPGGAGRGRAGRPAGGGCGRAGQRQVPVGGGPAGRLPAQAARLIYVTVES